MFDLSPWKLHHILNQKHCINWYLVDLFFNTHPPLYFFNCQYLATTQTLLAYLPLHGPPCCISHLAHGGETGEKNLCVKFSSTQLTISSSILQQKHRLKWQTPCAHFIWNVFWLSLLVWKAMYSCTCWIVPLLIHWPSTQLMCIVL